MKRISIGLLAIVAGGAILLTQLSSGASGARTDSTTAAEASELRNLSPPTSPELTEIYSKAMRSADVAGDAAPTEMETTTSTIGRAMTLADPGGQASAGLVDPRTGAPWTETAAYVVTMHGHFALNVPTPYGSPAPAGTVLTLMIDRSSRQVVGVHLGTSSVNLHDLNANVTRWANP